MFKTRRLWLAKIQLSNCISSTLPFSPIPRRCLFPWRASGPARPAKFVAPLALWIAKLPVSFVLINRVAHCGQSTCGLKPVGPNRPPLTRRLLPRCCFGARSCCWRDFPAGGGRGPAVFVFDLAGPRSSVGASPSVNHGRWPCEIAVPREIPIW